MIPVVDLAILAVVLSIHTLLAAVLTRYLRVRLNTTWGRAIYTALLVPVVLLGATLVTGQVGPDLDSRAAVLAVLVGLPAALGAAVDLLYVPQPEEYELPDTQEG